jgi:beta-aspartyl-dipeptidase (metallo-type)
LYTPDFIGEKDMLIAGSKILRLFDPGNEEADRLASSRLVVVLNASGAAVVPGLVDIHVHVTGGGGEAGPASRVPEAPLSQLLRGGLTTVVGVLGMDSVTRSPDVLLAKVTALNRGPLTAFMWTGAYSVLPEVPTVTGSIQRDLALIAPCVGVKVAISDHRASQAGPAVFRGIAGQAQVGGLVGGKSGLVYFHVGAHPDGLGPLWDIVKNTATPPGQLLPTHMGRTDALIRDGIAWALAGGSVDVSANSRAPAAVDAYLAAGVLPERISVSSDAFGSLPKACPSLSPIFSLPLPLLPSSAI